MSETVKLTEDEINHILETQQILCNMGQECEDDGSCSLCRSIKSKLQSDTARESLPEPVIVCLCGSTKFGEAFRLAQLQETLAGKIVLTIGCNMKSDTDLFGDIAEPDKESIKKMLDELHLRKIDLADEVLFLNVNGYIGESTLNELKYAKSNGKRIRFLEEVGAPSIRDPEYPCSNYEPINTAYGDEHSGTCETDGHYMCIKCVNREPLESYEELSHENVKGE